MKNEMRSGSRDVILDSINEGVFTVNLDWRITSFNRAAERITGISRKVDRKESEQYFNSRPEGSRLGAWASDQSREIPSREYLEEKYKQYSELYRNHDIPVPPHWGGYRVTPVRYEFWQGRESRLHDRITYHQESEIWKIKRLSP